MRARTLHENLVHFGGVQFTTERGLYVLARVKFGPDATAASGWADVHCQSTGLICTRNRAPNFYSG